MKKNFKYTLILAAFFIFWCNNISAQNIMHQPVVGGVGARSANILFFGDTPINYTITLHCSEGVMEIQHYTEDTLFFCNRLKINNLIPNTVYRYSISPQPPKGALNDAIEYQINSDQPPEGAFKDGFGFRCGTTEPSKDILSGIIEYQGSFKTFPDTGSGGMFSFAFGSCTEQSEDFDIFKTIDNEKPDFFIHLGDWLYNKFNTSTDISQQIELQHLKNKFIERYTYLADFLQHTPVDYIFDDEDGIYDDFSASSYCVIDYSDKAVQLREIGYPDSLKTILKKSLADFFPSYEEVDAGKSYHKFSYANADFFVIDNRSARSANSAIFRTTKKGKLQYINPKEHEILDSAQLKWLLDGLKNSEAKWKFIVSGITFNKSYKKVFNVCMRLQNRKLPNGKNGAYLAASLASMWFAYPNTQQKLLNFCNENQIKNVIILSGDAHSAAIDDGANAGFPEIMAGALAQKNSEIAGIIYNNFRMNLWNKGGQGIDNKNFNHAFGKITVNKNNAVLLEIIDDEGKIIASHEVRDGFIPEKFNLKKQIKINKFNTFGKKINIGFYQLFGKNKLK
jgi:hypothetical protein